MFIFMLWIPQSVETVGSFHGGLEVSESYSLQPSLGSHIIFEVKSNLAPTLLDSVESSTSISIWIGNFLLDRESLRDLVIGFLSLDLGRVDALEINQCWILTELSSSELLEPFDSSIIHVEHVESSDSTEFHSLQIFSFLSRVVTSMVSM